MKELFSHAFSPDFKIVVNVGLGKIQFSSNYKDEVTNNLEVSAGVILDAVAAKNSGSSIVAGLVNAIKGYIG